MRRPVRCDAAVGRVDRVGKGKDRLGEGIGVLDGGLDLGRLDLHVDVDRIVHHLAILVEIAHERLDAALEVEVHLARLLGPFVEEADVDATGEERHLAEARNQRVPVVFQHLEDGVVAHEGLDRAGVVGVALADHIHARHRYAAFKTLAVDLAVALDLGFHPCAQRVDGADADAVQTAGDLVAAAAKLAAGVQLGHDHRHGRHAGLLLDIDRDAGAVVFDGDAVILVDDDADAVAAPLHGLVDRVVDHFVDHVMQRLAIGAADVHTWAAAHGLQAFQHLDLIGGVVCLCSLPVIRINHKSFLLLTIPPATGGRSRSF